eukprot:m.42191 g.42191  ORF g.42191 m.42191 type:complete len:265 (+) comp15015_c0_seq1:128-922(+)
MCVNALQNSFIRCHRTYTRVRFGRQCLTFHKRRVCNQKGVDERHDDNCQLPMGNLVVVSESSNCRVATSNVLVETIMSVLIPASPITWMRFYDLGVLCVDRIAMTSYNNAYRHVNEPTDVLSFPNLALKVAGILPDPHINSIDANLGDIIVCPDVVRCDAEELAVPFSSQLAVVLAHALCHLSGYTHDTEMDAKKMLESEQAMLQAYAHRVNQLQTYPFIDANFNETHRREESSTALNDSKIVEHPRHIHELCVTHLHPLVRNF